jgi:hypothetical protein
MVSTRSPLTRISPASGRIRPSISFSATDFPAPLSPSRIAIVPVRTEKLTSRRMTWSSNAKETRSNSTASVVAIGTIIVGR